MEKFWLLSISEFPGFAMMRDLLGAFTGGVLTIAVSRALDGTPQTYPYFVATGIVALAWLYAMRATKEATDKAAAGNAVKTWAAAWKPQDFFIASENARLLERGGVVEGIEFTARVFNPTPYDAEIGIEADPPKMFRWGGHERVDLATEGSATTLHLARGTHGRATWRLGVDALGAAFLRRRDEPVLIRFLVHGWVNTANGRVDLRGEVLETQLAWPQ